ncbi:hypothetical protein [Embleya sp. AB8]|uniref:hypothetical protein n=1 Tax=Embleya sp. AB8 TaxID=3156304 RepID=UPI003C77E0EE
MITEAELHDVFSRALPDLRDEPTLPDFRDSARRRGHTVRRRRRLAGGVGALAVAGLAAWTALLPVWSSGPAERTSVPAAAGPATFVPTSAEAAEIAADVERGKVADAAQERLREILGRRLPDTVASVAKDPGDYGPWYVLTLRDGRTLRLAATDQAVRSFYGNPGERGLCGLPPGLPGGPDVPDDICDRRPLPDGGMAVAARFTEPKSGITFVWISILTPDGKSRYLVSEDIPDQGPNRARPLTADQLFTLAADREVVGGLKALIRSQR